MKTVIQNAIICPDGYILNTRSVHDYQEHDGYFIDGGTGDYSRFGCPVGCENKIESLMLFNTDDFQTKKKKTCLGNLW